MDSGIRREIKSWKFHKGDLADIWEVIRECPKGSAQDALIWQEITTPHCFNSYDAVDPDINYYQGEGWYTTEIEINNPFFNGKTILFFEGSGVITDVYLNTKHLHKHIGGYDQWEVDLTPYLIKNKTKYTLTIKCDNSRNIETIPSDLSDFNIYGGLYREVKIIYQPNIFIKNIQIIPTYFYEKNNGNILIKGKLNTPSKNLILYIKILDPSKKEIFKTQIIQIKDEFEETIKFESIHPWSPKTANLYSLEIEYEINHDKNKLTEKFGFRSFKFEKHGPFYLNGERLLLKGTHRHEEQAGRGCAQEITDLKKEMNLIKEMGANFIRLAHYQQSKEVLDLCDELGFLVWEEIPWCRGGLGNKNYKEMGKRLLNNMINQHFNHPSIIIWGLGNENDWPGDFSTFNKENIREYMNELNSIAHRLDPSRKTAIRRCDFCKDLVDIYSPSIWAGWYRGHYREYKEATLKHIRENDYFLHAEWGADSHPNRFSENPYLSINNLKTGIGTDERNNDSSLYGGIERVSKDGDWSENYACDLFDWTLKEQFTIKILTGSAFWPFKDFSTPLRKDNPIAYMNQKGVVQRDLIKKETYYVVQSYWSDKPMIRIFGHNWDIRWGKKLEEKEFRVYSNCPKVELFIDGKSLGTKKRNQQNFPSAGLRWKTPLSKGKHSILARAYHKKGVIEDSYNFEYQDEKWGSPKSIKSKYIKNKDNTLLWQIEVVDSKNRRCLDFKGIVYFNAAGISPLVINMGTSTGSKKIECSNGKAMIALNNSTEEAILVAHIEGLALCSEQYPPKEIV
ncbi:MAG: DUF4982 domain-containing protein [Sphaerochaetaceae bacterium]|nr:DUF4982 domain-containing protein [Sphaerochaetaceae bacterium]